MERVSSILGSPPRLGRFLAPVLAFALTGLPGESAAAPGPIYKCFERDLGLVYTDIPCKGGELMDLRAGEADPAALARLERERDALGRSSAQRIADLRHAELQRRQYAFAPAYAPDYDAPGYDSAGYFPYGYAAVEGGAQNRHRFPQARHDRRAVRQNVVPARMSPLMR
jgi:hypothetical protein